MPIRVVCRSCGRQLNAPDNVTGRKAKCPNCRAVLTIPAAEPVEVAPPAPKERKLPKNPPPESEERIAREPEVRDEAEEVVEVARVAKKPKRKKRKRPAKRVNQELPTWAVWLISVGGFILIAGSIALGAIIKGHGTLVLVYSVIMAVMIPISTVILIASMFISSWLGGGIEFGEAHVVIPKAIGLLLVVNTISLLPLGGFIAAPIWLFGLMFLFGLDLWETRILMVVNWGLNFFARMAVFGVVLAIFSHGDRDFSPNHRSGQQGAASEEAEAIHRVVDVGGDCSTENDDEDGPIVSVTLAGTRATDADLDRLKSFPKLRRLDLRATRITDAGLVHLKKLSQLETLTLTGTRVTNAGIADLQAALPRVRIVR
jgi:hypothetical protein